MNKFILSFLMFAAAISSGYGASSYKTEIFNIPKIEWSFCKGSRALQSECVVDGDTIRILYKNYRIEHLDTPEKRSKCQEEKELALKASDFTKNELNNAADLKYEVKIDILTNSVIGDKYGRPMMVVYIDGISLSEKLINAGLARSYEGKTKQKWC